MVILDAGQGAYHCPHDPHRRDRRLGARRRSSRYGSWRGCAKRVTKGSAIRLRASLGRSGANDLSDGLSGSSNAIVDVGHDKHG